MTALAFARSESRGVLRVVAAGLLLAGAIVGLVLVGILPERGWSRFLDASTWRFIGQGLAVTAQIGGVSLVASLILSVPLALGRIGLPTPFRIPVALWIEGVRATPVLAILFIVFFGFPRLGIDLSGVQAATIGLTVYTSAVLSEIVRAGVLSIPRGEVEAARSLGMSSDDVASSRISTAGSARNARANDTNCRWPADRRPPRFRTSVS